uniref:Choline transporter-like protein n=1 Tax=Ciona savignyi TaxID=51511 RepID=H2Z0D4_CIOSA
SGTLCTSEEDPDYKDFELPVVEDRRFTDFPGIIVFLAVLIGMCVAMHMGLAYGKPTVFTNGVDSWGNICGQTNTAHSGVEYSGKDMTNFKRVLIADFLSNPDALTATGKTTTLCVRLCPLVTSSFQCQDYLANKSNYNDAIANAACQGVGGKDLAFDEKNNRCVPSHAVKGLSIQKQNALLNLYSQDWLHNLVHDCHVCAAELTWITLIAFAFTLVFLAVMQGASSALCYFSFATFFVVGGAATGYMWYLYTLINAVDSGLSVNSPSGRSLFAENAGYSVVFRDTAIVCTVIVVGFSIICVLVSRRGMDACAVLFEYATEAIMEIKWVYLLPLYTIASLAFGFGLWLYTIKHITAVFKPQLLTSTVQGSGLATASYVPDTTYSTWVLVFEFVAIIWIMNFVLACQHLMTSLVVGTWYFSVDKTEMYRPMRVATSRLIRKHLGSAVIGSFFSGYFGLLRSPLSYVNSGCSPFFWFLNHVLVYISDMNYHMVSLKGCWFFTAGKLIRDRLEVSPGITAISSFALFLGKMTVTLSVLPFGFLLLKDKVGVFMYGYPLAVGALLSFLVAHVFISMFNAAVGAVFVCYVEDTAINAG